MNDDELAYLSATDAIRAFRRARLSPVELVEAVIERSRRLGAAINPYTYTFYERALGAARRAQARYRRDTARPLEGIPIVIKDLHPMKGEITTYGSRLFAEHRDAGTHPGVARLLAAGAILVARSTTPELGIDQVCSTALWGMTRNPWNLACSPGASSAGAAAALAAGMTTLADGSDYGGSIRIPAAFCGVFGYMPPFGRNPNSAPGNLDSFLHHGPLTRTVADAALMQNVLSGPHPADIATLRERVRIPARLAGVRGWRVALSMDLGYFEVDPQIVANTAAAAAVFRALGCRVENVRLDWSLACLAAFEIHAAAGLAGDEHLWEHRHRLAGVIAARLERGRRLEPRDIAYAARVRARMYESLGALLERYDVLLCPSARVTDIPAAKPALDWETFEVDGRRVSGMNQATLAYPFNMLGQLPVANVPTGFSSRGVPTGMQIVGRSYDDVGVFRAARAYERARPWLDRAAARPQI